jgi:hypothetical protein
MLRWLWLLSGQVQPANDVDRGHHDQHKKNKKLDMLGSVMEIGKILAVVSFYLIVGFMVWLNVRLENDASLRTNGFKKWKQPRFFKLVPLWFPFYFISFFSKEQKLTNWLYK